MESLKRVIALGFFDGVHRGHGLLLERTKERASQLKAVPAVLSFDVHPDTLVFGSDVKLINSAADRKELIRSYYGIEEVLFLHFDRQIMHTPWKVFLDTIIAELNACQIVIGQDFCCGDRGEGKAELIRDYCETLGVGCDVLPALGENSRVISSTWIKELIECGDMEKAEKLLGHPHMLSDTVRSGFHLGHKLGAPTINMAFPEGVLIPKFGVYASKIYLESGEEYNAVTNIGIRPTVNNGDKVSVESHLLDFSGDLYGQPLKVAFLKFLRPERKFESTEELARQIRLDTETARAFFEKKTEVS